MRVRRKAGTLLLATAALAMSATATAATVHVRDALYAAKANPKLPYSNGAVDLVVYAGGRRIRPSQSGESCYTGATPPAGVPSNDEITLRTPHAMTIGSSGRSSFSGPITVAAQDAQTPAPLKTSFSIKGTFARGKHGTYMATGTASSPVCQRSTPTRFRVSLSAGG